MNPVKDLVNERTDEKAYPAISSLRKMLASGKEAEDAYVLWRKNPLTVAFLAALAEYSDTNPVDVRDQNTALVRYGMTCGLDLAYRLMTQPARMFPEVFGGKSAMPVDTVLDQAYVDTPDSVIDQMQGA